MWPLGVVPWDGIWLAWNRDLNYTRPFLIIVRLYRRIQGKYKSIVMSLLLLLQGEKLIQYAYHQVVNISPNRKHHTLN